MSDKEFSQVLREGRKALRAAEGIECPTCRRERPKSNPTILLPKQRCKVCGYRDPRARPPGRGPAGLYEKERQQ